MNEDGFCGRYRGGLRIAISFLVYDALRSGGHKKKRPSDSMIMVSLACGSLGEIAPSTTTFPIDLNIMKPFKFSSSKEG